MANRYWVPFGGTGTGNWNDTNHWSATSGGAGGASFPVAADNAYFDANSFNGAGQVVTCNVVPNCLDMDWTGATNNPTFINGSGNWNLYGSLTYIVAMTVTVTSPTSLGATATGKTITMAGHTHSNNFDFSGVGGGWTLQDALSLTSGSGDIFVTRGTLNTNGKAVSCASLNISGTLTRSLILGSSIVTIATDFDATTSTLLTFNAGTSNIIMTGSSRFFKGGGLTYYNYTPTGSNFTISGSNTFNSIPLPAGKTLKLTSGTTQTITNPVFNGTTALPSTLQSVTAGSAATIALPAGRYFIRHTSIKDITITGATTTTSIAGTNVSGNTGITFVTKFEMGRIKNDGSFNWYSTATGTVDKVSG